MDDGTKYQIVNTTTPSNCGSTILESTLTILNANENDTGSIHCSAEFVSGTKSWMNQTTSFIVQCESNSLLLCTYFQAAYFREVSDCKGVDISKLKSLISEGCNILKWLESFVKIAVYLPPIIESINFSLTLFINRF